MRKTGKQARTIGPPDLAERCLVGLPRIESRLRGHCTARPPPEMGADLPRPLAVKLEQIQFFARACIGRDHGDAISAGNSILGI